MTYVALGDNRPSVYANFISTSKVVLYTVVDSCEHKQHQYSQRTFISLVRPFTIHTIDTIQPPLYLVSCRFDNVYDRYDGRYINESNINSIEEERG
jgi:hypothetical protein